jgi:hypothetical protein
MTIYEFSDKYADEDVQVEILVCKRAEKQKQI